MNKGNLQWTAEQDDALRTLRGQGLSFSQIARRLGGGLSRNACIGRAGRLGLPPAVRGGSVVVKNAAPPWSAQEDSILRQAWADNASYEEIAGMIAGRTAYSVECRRRLLKLPPRMRVRGADTASRRFENEPEACGPVRDFPARGCCRWIHGDVQRDDWRCCGAPAFADGASWCAHHAERVGKTVTEEVADRAVSRRAAIHADRRIYRVA